MSITILLFKETPFEDIAPNVPKWLTNIQFCDGKTVFGDLQHCTFRVEHQPANLHGYLLSINDVELDCPNLWVVHLDAGSPDNPDLDQLCQVLSFSTGTDILKAYMSGPNAVIEFNGGATDIRNNFALANRKHFGVIG
ncbi:hypothetical protein D3C80_1804220 [compost metagenome]